MDIFIPPVTTPHELMPSDFMWMFDLDLASKNNVPSISPTIQNIVAILENDPWLRGRIAYNQFSLNIEKSDVPWGTDSAAWDDHDLAQLRRHLEWYRKSGFSRDKVKDALGIVAREHAYHPVKRYLESLAWDGSPRLATLFIDQLKAADNDVYRKAAICFAVKAVQRIYEPGCNLQFMPVFIGKQGCGKSSMASILGGEWMSDSAVAVGQKDGYMALQGKWIIEIGEMDSFRGKEIQAVKSFISSSSDYFRQPYAQTCADVKRQCIFYGTTNDTLCLSDNTGNRRFWPIECGADITDVQSRIACLRGARDQIWAEAVWLYKNDLESVESMVGDLGKDMTLYQNRHNVDDPISYEVAEFLETPLPSDWHKLTTEQRHQWYQGGEAYRNDYYAARLLSHDTDWLRERATYKEFASEYLGIQSGAQSYVSMSHRFHRGISQHEGWLRDEQRHRDGKERAHITYWRVKQEPTASIPIVETTKDFPPLPFSQEDEDKAPF